MRSGVLQAAHDFRRDDIAGDANDEELAKVGVEKELGGNPRVAATEDGRVRMLSSGEIGECLFANGGEASFSTKKALAAFDERCSASCAEMVG